MKTPRASLLLVAAVFYLTACGEATGPGPVVDVWITEYVSDAYGESLVFLAFGARSFPSVPIVWSLEDDLQHVGPVYGREPGGTPLKIEAWFPTSQSVNLVFTATPKGGEPRRVRWTRIKDRL